MTNQQCIEWLQSEVALLKMSHNPGGAEILAAIRARLIAADEVAGALRKLRESGEILENEERALANWEKLK